MDANKAEFMGKITAGITHEMKNVLAIIKESAGLLEDLIAMTKDNNSIPIEKMARSISRINDQVGRGVNLATKLSAFAHTAYEESTGAEINELVQQTGFLCQRFARLKQVNIEIRTADPPHNLKTDPLALQIFLFECMQLLINAAGKNATITIQSKAQENRVVMTASDGEIADSASERTDAFDDSTWKTIIDSASFLNLAVQTGEPPRWIAIDFGER